jgi:Deacetylase PdaC/Protein of unknown function (DUF3298)
LGFIDAFLMIKTISDTAAFPRLLNQTFFTMKTNFFYLFVVLSVFFACKSEQKPAAKLPMTFSQQRITQDAVTDSTHFFKVDIQYLVAENGDANLTKAINDSVQSCIIGTLLMSSGDTSSAKNDLATAVQKFRMEYEKMMQEDKAAPADERFHVVYDYNAQTKVDFKSEKITCISISEDIYTGGAHPNAFVSFLVFDNKTGKTIDLAEIVKDRKGFDDLVEQTFREVRKADIEEPKKSLEDNGFFVDEKTKRLPLPANFSVSEDGKSLYFMYNSYEVAAYAYGPTDFSIPLDQLTNLLDLSRLR